jgi:hypothetical protein
VLREEKREEVPRPGTVDASPFFPHYFSSQVLFIELVKATPASASPRPTTAKPRVRGNDSSGAKAKTPLQKLKWQADAPYARWDRSTILQSRGIVVSEAAEVEEF